MWSGNIENIINALRSAVEHQEIKMVRAQLEFEMNRLNEIDSASALAEQLRLTINALLHNTPTAIQLIELETLAMKSKRLFK